LKPYPFGILAVFLATVAFALLLTARPPAGLVPAERGTAARVTATGEAVVWAPPDVAEVTFRVRGQGADVAAAESDLQVTVTRIAEELRHLVPRESVRVTGRGIRRETDVATPDGSALFVSTATLQVRLSDPDRVDAVVATVMGLGARCEYEGAVYRREGFHREERTAVERALAAARERAAMLAGVDPDRLEAMPEAEVEVTVEEGTADRVPIRARVRATFAYRP